MYNRANITTDTSSRQNQPGMLITGKQADNKYEEERSELVLKQVDTQLVQQQTDTQLVQKQASGRDLPNTQYCVCNDDQEKLQDIWHIMWERGI